MGIPGTVHESMGFIAFSVTVVFDIGYFFFPQLNKRFQSSRREELGVFLIEGTQLLYSAVAVVSKYLLVLKRPNSINGCRTLETFSPGCPSL